MVWLLLALNQKSTRRGAGFDVIADYTLDDQPAHQSRSSRANEVPKSPR